MATVEEVPRKFDIEVLRARVTKEREEDTIAFEKWMEGLTKTRQDLYKSLDIMSWSDSKNKEYILRRCRFALELLNSMRSIDGRGIVPVGFTMQGDDFVIFIQADGHKTREGAENFKEFTYTAASRINSQSQDEFHCDIDVTEYGINTTHDGPDGYLLDNVEVEKRIGWMKSKG